ncbi:hypothetical protein, partial [Colwellia sp. TT2012]|uniref:hypothetical protein n=1 Tax=Colwellia sp. TT2012 TaxID=1720342 RepID=UPI0018D22256
PTGKAAPAVRPPGSGDWQAAAGERPAPHTPPARLKPRGLGPRKNRPFLLIDSMLISGSSSQGSRSDENQPP